jgi:zinc protease
MKHPFQAPWGRLALLAGCLVLASPGRGATKESDPLPKNLPPYGQDKPLPVAKIDQSTLANGLRIWMVQRTGLPRVSAILAVRGGTAADPADMLGISRVLADALKEGTASRSAQQIAEEAQSFGGALNASANDDAFQIAVSGFANHTPRILGLLADVARHASFPDGEIELAKANALQDLMVQESNSSVLVEKAICNAVFGTHPYRLVTPKAEVIQAITPQGLRAEYLRRFRPDRALLVLVGVMDPQEAKAEVEKAFGSWKAQGPAVPPTAPVGPPLERKIVLVDRPGSVQSEIRVGSLAVRKADPDFYAVRLANTVFGASSTSRLYENIREEKGYTYTPNSGVNTFEQGGMLEAEAAVRNEVTAAAIMEILYEMDRMGALPVSDEELARAKRYETGLYLLRNETRGGVAGSLVANWVDGLEAEALAEYVPKINQVTAGQLRAAGKKYFASKNQVIAVAGDAQAIETDLEQFGKVEKVQP